MWKKLNKCYAQNVHSKSESQWQNGQNDRWFWNDCDIIMSAAIGNKKKFHILWKQKCDSQQLSETQRKSSKKVSQSVRPVRKVRPLTEKVSQAGTPRKGGSTRRKQNMSVCKREKNQTAFSHSRHLMLICQSFLAFCFTRIEKWRSSSFISQHSQRLYICQAFSVSAFIYAKLAARNAHKQILLQPINFRQLAPPLHSFDTLKS